MTKSLNRIYPLTYAVWKALRNRCRNPRNDSFEHYGGRGISVCERWDDFSAFLEDMGPKPEGRSIDRIDVNGNYEPRNCRWADHEMQASNTRRTRFVIIGGEKFTLSGAARKIGSSVTAVHQWVKAGDNVEERAAAFLKRKQEKSA